MKRHWLMLFIALTLVRCGEPEMPSAPAISETPLNVVALEYRLIDFLTDGRGFSALAPCSDSYNPAYFAVSLEDRSLVDIPEFAHDNPAGLALIQQRMGIPVDPAALNAKDMAALYQEILTLETINLGEHDQGKYRFESRIKNAEGTVILVQGIITDHGAIDVAEQHIAPLDCALATPAP